MNPFVSDRGDSEELLQRIGSLRRLIEVMVGERLSAERRSSLDHALASYYAQRRERTGFRDFYAYLEGETPEIAHLLRPFATGSLRDLLSDEGDDLLAHEALVTVFDLHLLEPELRPAAAMVRTNPIGVERKEDMNLQLNPRKILFGNHSVSRPALLAVTPPRTGERTMLGVENLLQSIAVPEPFSLELAGAADGVTLLARCLDREVVRGQLAAHYPQARIQKVDPEDDPIFVHRGEEAWGMTLRASGPDLDETPARASGGDDAAGLRLGVRAPAHLPGRRPAGPGFRPLIAIIGALSNLKDGERVLARLLLRSLGPDWSQSHQQKAFRNPGHQRPDPSYTYQTRPLQLYGVTMAVLGVGALAALRDYLWVQDGEIWKAALLGIGSALGLTGRLGLVALEAGPEPRLRPADHQGEGGPHRLRQRAVSHRRAARGQRCQGRPEPGQGGAGAGGRRLPPLRPPRRGAVQDQQGQAGGSRDEPPPRRAGLVWPAQRPGGPRGRRPVAPTRRPGRDSPLGTLRLPGAAALGPGRPGRRPGGRHHGGTVEGDPLPRGPAAPPPPLRGPHPHGQVHSDAPHRCPQAPGEGGGGPRRHRGHRPPRRPGGRPAGAGPGVHRRPGEAHRPGRPRGFPGINLLDARIFADRDRTADSVVRVAHGLWNQWGPRMQSILEHTVKSLHEANRHPATAADEQFTLLDGLLLLSDDNYRTGVLTRVSNQFIMDWWGGIFASWRRDYQGDALAPVQTRLSYYASSETARAIIGQPRSTIDLRRTIREGGILPVSTAQGAVGRDVAALVGASLLNLVDAAIREQGSLPPEERRGALVVWRAATPGNWCGSWARTECPRTTSYPWTCITATCGPPWERSGCRPSP